MTVCFASKGENNEKKQNLHCKSALALWSSPFEMHIKSAKKAATYLVSDIWERMNLGVFVSNVWLGEGGEVVSVLEDILEAHIHKT